LVKGNCDREAMTTERDSRGYWSLPERREEQSYYVYGTPPDGAGQFAHPNMLSFLFILDFVWGQRSDAKLGIGNISLRDGADDRHASHTAGLSVDMRLIRKDRRHEGVSRFSTQYDRVETGKLVATIWQVGAVKVVYFNDPFVSRTTPFPGHDNHLHVSILP